jgi:hypothetical protein
MVHLLINPVEEIETAYSNANFFAGFALAVMYFEREANQLLGIFFYKRISLYIIERWSLAMKMRMMYGLNLIEKETHDKIQEIVRIRNCLIHPSERRNKQRRRNDLFLRFRLYEEEKSSLLNFKECYSLLLKADSRLWKEKFGDKAIDFP